MMQDSSLLCITSDCDIITKFRYVKGYTGTFILSNRKLIATHKTNVSHVIYTLRYAMIECYQCQSSTIKESMCKADTNAKDRIMFGLWALVALSGE